MSVQDQEVRRPCRGVSESSNLRSCSSASATQGVHEELEDSKERMGAQVEALGELAARTSRRGYKADHMAAKRGRPLPHVSERSERTGEEFEEGEYAKRLATPGSEVTWVRWECMCR
jgi:hypothetical protein